MPRNQGTSRKGKPKKNERAAGMGRALQKAKGKRHTPSSSVGGMAMRQGVESINIQKEDQRASVLDVNELDDFLIQAEMANKQFHSEKQQMVMLDMNAQHYGGGRGGETEIQNYDLDNNKNNNNNNHYSSAYDHDQQQGNKKVTDFAFHELSVPRRPKWDETTTPNELDSREKESFLNWRRNIAKKEEEIVLSSSSSSSGGAAVGVTPFEKNIEIWRQLWRVMERCSMLIQVVDARNPLFYLSKDLRDYATKELGKPMLLLVNKSDYLTSEQRKAWTEFLSSSSDPNDDCSSSWDHVFFSAHEQQQRIDEEAAMKQQQQREEEQQHYSEELTMIPPEDDNNNQDDDNVKDDGTESAKDIPSANKNINPNKNVGVEIPLSRTELLTWLREYAKERKCDVDPKYERLSFGMVGFPNVGKSSVINVLMGNAKHAHGVVRVGVAAQPGKTKHFQTLLLPNQDNDLMLCDCPGLVFPSFVNNTADLIAAGVYPISQMRDPWPVVNLLCRRIPRPVLNAKYGITIPPPSADTMLRAKKGEIPPPTAEEFLTAYCVARSMLAAGSGVPDFQRASRYVVSDYAVGKLLYCHAPPDADDEIYQQETLTTAMRNTKRLQETLQQQQQQQQQGDQERDQNPADDDHSSSSGGEEEEDDDDDDESDVGIGRLGIEDDDMLLELMGQDATSTNSSQPSSTKREHTRKKRWGKKGRKLRNNDPYGCHSTPDDMLANDHGPLGVTVNGGKKKSKKNGKKGYVRPTAYGANRGVGL